MKISDKFKKGRTVFSFEVFPPKKTSPIETIYDTLEQLSDLKPDFISVTYGTGSKEDKYTTCEIASIIKNKYNIDPVAHLTCISSSRQDVVEVLSQLKENNIENILALRGDINPNIPVKEDFKYASQLVEFIKKDYDFHISGACYPEGHGESASMVDDIINLKKKVDAGATHLMSQLFFDNNVFYSFLEKAKIAGINVPIEAGIMPVTKKSQIERMVTQCGVSLPNKFVKIMQKYDGHPQALTDAGIAYAIDQIVDLVSNGVDGIHLYTMNNPYVAKRITESVGSLIKVD